MWAPLKGIIRVSFKVIRRVPLRTLSYKGSFEGGRGGRCQEFLYKGSNKRLHCEGVCLCVRACTCACMHSCRCFRVADGPVTPLQLQRRLQLLPLGLI